ncbi:hypothetical protein [Zhihengliuella halotolerans]|uniref:hypothetical protein n=1 Tax=Zhihengliuella halotolerans TaxID=370736 RepID=UPI0015E0AF22|nr:hypothetical protein [Zhihengliuella halotolerans]
MPMLSRKTYGGGNHKWLASTHGTGNAPTGTLDIAAFTAGTHYPDGYIPSGTPVDASDLAAVAPYTAPAAGEPALNLGFVLGDVEVVGDEAMPAAILRHGSIVTDFVPGTFTAPDFAPGFTFE